jgi:hypothetical protein
MKTKLVYMENVIGDLVHEHGVPVLTFDQLTTLGQRAVRVYDLVEQGKRITFSELCECICNFISTPFGARVLKKIQNNL